MKKAMMAVAMMATLALGACGGEGGADGEVTKALDAHYERALCANFVPQPPFTIFTQSVTGGDKAALAAQILTEAGILTKTDEKNLGAGNVTATFDATEKGAKIIQGSRICYGKAKVEKIIEASDPEKAMGTEVRRVKVRVSFEITEPWAKNPALAYLVQTGEHEMTHVLMKNGSGWSVAQ